LAEGFAWRLCLIWLIEFDMTDSWQVWLIAINASFLVVEGKIDEV
jgi:hypothetical protein